jgi:hypothetical protein
VLSKQGLVTVYFKERMGLPADFFGKGLRVQFTYGKRNKSVILLRYTIGTLKVNRVEIVWFFLNNVSHGEQSSWWCKLQCSGNSYKIKRYCHPLPPHAKNKGQIK